MRYRHPDIAKLHGSYGVFTGDLPLLHLAGQALLLTQPLYLGAKIVLISMHKDPNYKFERFLKAVEKHKVKNYIDQIGHANFTLHSGNFSYQKLTIGKQ